MKKFVLMSIVLVNSIAIFGQTSKGNFFLSGSTGLQISSNNIKTVYDGVTSSEYHLSSFSFLPTVGYFIIDNLAIGLSSNISSTTQKTENGNKSISSSTTIAPMAYYFIQLDDKIKPFFHAGVGYSSYVNKYIPKTGSDSKNSSNGLAFGLGGGIFYFISENISFNFGLHYTIQSLTNGDDEKQKLKQGGISSDLGIAIFF